MKIIHWRLRDWIAAIWAFTLGCVALLTIYPGMKVSWNWASDNASNIASWVQAAGSIAAIWGAFRVANIQFAETRAREAETERQSKRRKYMFLLDRFNAARVIGTVVHQSLTQQFGGLKIHLMSTDATLAIISRISIDEVPDLELMADVSHLRIRIETLKYQLVRGLEVDEITQEHQNDTIKAAASVEEWGGISGSTCKRRLELISTPAELEELRTHFDALKEAVAVQTKNA